MSEKRSCELVRIGHIEDQHCDYCAVPMLEGEIVFESEHSKKRYCCKECIIKGESK
jgi:hypothetical protein